MNRKTLSKSEAGTFLLCPQKHVYKYHIKADPIQNWPGRKEFGIAFHEALATYYKTKEYTKALETWNEQCNSLSISRTNALKGEVLLLGWVARFPFTQYELLLIEERMEITIADFSFKFIADLLVKHKSSGKVIVVDHKTTGSNIFHKSRYWLKLGNSLQARSYILALQNSGYDLNTIRFCTTRIPKEKPEPATEELQYYKRNCKGGRRGDLKPGQRKEPESENEFQDRLFNLIADNPNKYYLEKDFVFTSDDLKQTREELEALFKLTSAGVPVRNEDACFAFNNKCEYYDVCWRGESIYDENVYQIRTNIHE